jgi:hypothetical protein
LSASADIAGGEIEFSQTSGLKYLKYVPASGIDNKLETSVQGKYYVGFFAIDNKYKPVCGSVSVGNLVFGYSGSAPEKITVREIKLHTKTDAGVDSKVVKSNTVINITRKPASDNTGNNGSGNGNTGTNGSGNNTGAGTSDNIPVVTLSSDEESSSETVDIQVSNVPAADSATSENATTGLSSKSAKADSADNAKIGSNNTPLSSGEGSALSDVPTWLWIVIAVVVVALVGTLLFLLFKRRKKNKEKVSSQAL